LTITAGSLRKIDQHDNFTAPFPVVTMTVVRDGKIRTELRTNRIVAFVAVLSWDKTSMLNI